MKNSGICRTILNILVLSALAIGLFTPLGKVSVVKSQTPTVQTSIPTVDCSSSQIIMMIDQSSSMPKNDPTNMRYDAPLYVADVMARNYINARLVSSRLNKPKKLELAVVEFGDKAIPALGWTTIAPVNDAAWVEQRKEIEKVVDAQGVKNLNLDRNDGTNYVRAFEAAETLAQQNDSQQTNCPDRTLMLVTDGYPFDVNTNFVIYGSALTTYMNQVRAIVDRTFSGSNNRLYITGANVTGSTDNGVNYWKDTESEWKRITHDSERTDPTEPGRAEKAETKPEIGFRIAKIVNYALHGGLVEAKPGNAVIPPYLERVVFTFYKPDINNVMDLYDGKGKLDESRTDVTVRIIGAMDGGIQTIEVLRPKPGTYKLVTNAKTDEFIITQDMIYVQATIDQSNLGLQQFTTSSVKLNLVDSDNKPIPDYDQKYRLTVEAMVTPPADSGAKPYPISLTHDNIGHITGNFTPIYKGTNHISITAEAPDDSGKVIKVLTVPYADFDINVDPVTVVAGDAVSDRASTGCSPSQFTPFTFPLRLVNQTTNSPAKISLKVDWKVQGDGITLQEISAPDPDMNIKVKATGDKPGALNIAITATTQDPLSNSPLLINQQTKTVVLNESKRYTFSLQQVGPPADGIVSLLEDQRRALTGSKTPDYLVIGRRFFFFKSDLLVNASFVENGTTTSANRVDLLPAISFEAVDGSASITGGTWNSSATGVQQSVSGLGLSSYRIKLDPKAAPCAVEITPIQQGPVVSLVSDLGERIISVISVVIGVLLLFLLMRYLLSHLTNPLKGFLAIVPSGEGKANWYHSLSSWTWLFFKGQSRWSFTIHNPHSNGLIYHIDVDGIFHSSGAFTLTYYQMDPKANKKNKRKVQCDLNNWRPINLGNGYMIIWARFDNGFPH